MNPAVRQAIEARIAALNAEIQTTEEITTSYVHQRDQLQELINTHTATLDALEAERDELANALPDTTPTTPTTEEQ